MQSEEFEDRQASRQTDRSAIRILKKWIAKHDGVQPNGEVIDRTFVMVGRDLDSTER